MRKQIELLSQCSKDVLDKIEILISDNCSTDDTQQIVEEAIQGGFSCTYIRNEINLGMDGNFVSCFRKASGKYVWLLGDDDIIIPNALRKIVDFLEVNNDLGLVHIYRKKNKISTEEFVYFSNSEKFIKTISYFTTYISSNIVNTKYVPQINFEKYMGTWFTLMPLYIKALLTEDKNCLVNFKVVEDAADLKRNGGYNYFQIFITNYLSIWHEFLMDKMITSNTYEFLKRDIFEDVISNQIYIILLKGEKGNYNTDKAWNIIISNYWSCFYFYKKFLRIMASYIYHLKE